MINRNVRSLAIMACAIGLMSGLSPAFGDPVQVTTGGGTEPSISPDGAWVSYVAPGAGIRCSLFQLGSQRDARNLEGPARRSGMALSCLRNQGMSTT